MEAPKFNATPEQLAWGMLIALGLLVIVRDLLNAFDMRSMHSQAQAYFDDPNKLAGEALEHLGQDPGVVDLGYHEREEHGDE